MLSKNSYTLLSAISLLGAITLAILSKPDAQFVLLAGMAGTLAGRGNTK